MMIKTLWSQKIKDYAPTNTIEQENVLRELTQLIFITLHFSGGLRRGPSAATGC